MRQRLAAVLFDLDGTLADSAPGLADAANDMLVARALPPLPYDMLRPAVGSGARGMVGTAFGMRPGDAGYDALRDEFLQRYEGRMLEKTRLFDGVAEVLEQLSAQGLPWGIVTNKAERFAVPLTRALGLRPHREALVCGDSTPHTKPHPAPVLEAVRRLGVPPAACAYVGDDHRDMLAARAAGTGAIAAAWGYLGHGAVVEAWGADAVLAHPIQLLQCLELA
jgi:phosphoglycolate phosphatase